MLKFSKCLLNLLNPAPLNPAPYLSKTGSMKGFFQDHHTENPVKFLQVNPQECGSLKTRPSRVSHSTVKITMSVFLLVYYPSASALGELICAVSLSGLLYFRFLSASLPHDMSSFMDLRKVIGFQCVQVLFCRMKTCKFLKINEISHLRQADSQCNQILTL